MDDNNKGNSDYEPNFILRDTDAKADSGETSGDDAQRENAQHEVYHRETAAYTQPGSGSQNDPTGGASAAGSYSSAAGDYTSAAGGYSSATGSYTSSGNYSYGDNTGDSASWDNKHGLGKVHKNKRSSAPVTLTRRTLALIIILCVVVSGCFGIGGAALMSNNSRGSSSSSTDSGSVSSAGYSLEDATGSNMTVQEITDSAKGSVVSITTEGVASDSWMQQYVTEGAGSGIVITDDGYIMTNNHVIEDANKITVTTADDKEYSAKLIGTDTINDVAILKIKASDLSPVTYGNSDQLQVGDMAVAIGNPLGELGGTVTAGIISALDRELEIDGTTMNLLQTDTSINPGNSGGGLFNGDGQLIGVVVAKSSGSDVEGLGFAIPINTAAEVAQQLMDQGYVSGQPSTGMTYTETASSGNSIDQIINNLQGNAYVYIYSVEGENAKKAGFEPGDIVYAVDGEEITSFNDLSAIVTSHKVGDKLKFTIIRDDEEKNITLELEEKSAE